MLLVVAGFLLYIVSLASCQDDQLQATYQDSLAAAVAQFTQSIYVHLAKTSDQENFVFSPLSLHSALSLLYLATTDNSPTQDQLGAAMGIINSHDLVKTAYQKQIQQYRNQTSFLYGNHIWIGNEFVVDQEYKDAVENNFGSEISSLDFETKGAVDKVNKWIEKTTNGKIKNLVESFSADTQMFLANALYFKENWLIPFEDRDYDGNLIERVFQTDSGSQTVPMVWQESDKFGYGQIETGRGVLEVVTIPYMNENFEMQIIMAEGNKQFNILESMMEIDKERDGGKFNLFSKPKNESEFQYDEVHIMFPKFLVKSKFNAAEALKTLGATEVFTSGAELDKITAGGPIAVGNILHEAVIEVTKDGTEGSAATGVELTLFSAGFQKHIMVDRPFIFIIQDKVNNIPILVGRIKNPTIQNP
eukprot:TRINITY_DN6512_c0_g1_i2.p1 TRINITY_DN6512_c0_g1~~TRINITY_DN6512_c0_g1_i2.p1  ORF type:complete len:418 (+),score=114.87 TRINITY_DN6512_c0_g1_i2:30-1283(+)